MFLRITRKIKRDLIRFFRNILGLFTHYNDIYRPQKCIYFLGSADYSNIGDLAISEATIQVLQRTNLEIIDISLHEYDNYHFALKKNVKKEDLIVIQGGGNLGVNYFEAEANRRRIIKAFRKNKIILFPSTIDYGQSKKGIKQLHKSIRLYNRCDDLILCAREYNSYNSMRQYYNKCGVIFVPDIVLNYHIEIPIKNRLGFGICLRNDIEKSSIVDYSCISDRYDYELFDNVSSEKVINKCNRYDIVFRQLEKINEFEFIITDRLHIMIFCYLLRIPCLALDNSNKKISGVYEFIKDCGFIFMNISIQDFLEKCEQKSFKFYGVELEYSELLSTIC